MSSELRTAPRHNGASAIPRPRRRSLVVLAGDGLADERAASALASSLSVFGFDVTYLGREEDPRRLAAAVASAHADAVELCVPQRMPVELIRELLRELASVGRSDARIVLHRLG